MNDIDREAAEKALVKAGFKPNLNGFDWERVGPCGREWAVLFDSTEMAQVVLRVPFSDLSGLLHTISARAQCPDCGGSGEHLIQTYDPTTYMADVESIPCKRCAPSVSPSLTEEERDALAVILHFIKGEVQFMSKWDAQKVEHNVAILSRYGGDTP